MNEILSAIATRLDGTHLALLCVIVILVYLLLQREKQSQKTTQLTADALAKVADAITNFRIELARKATR
jgi:hypothetical protein